MGCGCGKNKKKKMKSSRMPTEAPKMIGNISIPVDMTPNQRRSTISKINNDRKYSSPKKRKPNVADRIMREKVSKKECDG
jgi:hypothetical protein